MYKKRGSSPFWAFVMVISFLVLVFVFVKFGDTDKVMEENKTAAGHFYKPATYTNAVIAANEVYAQMAGSYYLGCKCTEMSESTKGICYLTSNNGYSKSCNFVTTSETSYALKDSRGSSVVDDKYSFANISFDQYEANYKATEGVNYNAMFDGNGNMYLEYLLGLNPLVVDSKGTVNLYDLYHKTVEINGAGYYIEIISPFDFTWCNNNTDGETTPERIIILSNSGDVRITFDSCANWFCAGIPGTTSVMGEQMDVDADGNAIYVDVTAPWESHGRQEYEYTVIDDEGKEKIEKISNPHYTIFGNSSNAELKGGAYGKVIGYADSDTTVCIEIMKDGAWTPISYREWLVGQ